MKLLLCRTENGSEVNLACSVIEAEEFTESDVAAYLCI